MIRSAAKNWQDVAVIVVPKDYAQVIEEMRANDASLSLASRSRLANEAFGQTARYDMMIYAYLSGAFPRRKNEAKGIGGDFGGSTYSTITSQGISSSATAPKIDSEEFSIETFHGSLPGSATWTISKAANLRYGENPHQIAGLYKTGMRSGIANAELLSGKEMSFNNYVDADAAWQLVCEFDEPACAIIKHTNPAGVALGAFTEEAYRRALATDPTSAFGGVVASNLEVDAGAARAIVEIFTEVIIAPEYERAALEILKTKKNLRVLRARERENREGVEYKQITGGMLVQTRDNHKLNREDLKIVTEREPTEDEIRDLLFAWTVCKHTKSNAIVYAREGQTVGVGAGQMSRVDSVKLGAMRAQLPIKGSVLASDAFFPFRDGIDEAAKHGITAVIQPGGSVRDPEVIAAADEHGLAMVFTGVRHFKH